MKKKAVTQGKIICNLLDGQWRTIADIAKLLEYKESSIGSQLRQLRKQYIVEKRLMRKGLWAYRVRERKEDMR